MRRRSLIVIAAVPLAALAACGTSEDKPAGSATIAITASDDACQVAASTVPAGKTTFSVTNKGSKITEVYVYGAQDGKYTKVVSEVENIGPGLTRELTADLTGGEYEIACKPGQSGDGIRTRITVTGGAPSGAPSATVSAGQAAYDREIEIAVTATGVTGADALTAKTGEKIEFKLENKTTGQRELEVIDPSGKIVAKVEVAAGTTGEVVVPLTAAGAWKLKVEGPGGDIEKTLTVA